MPKTARQPTAVTPIAPTLTRPLPPDELREYAHAEPLEQFAPAPSLWEWVRATFLEEDAPLYNPTHVHLRQADVGILWTNVGNTRHGRRILGQAEMPMMKGGKWQVARQELQMRDWFGDIPDFVITLDAPFAAECDDVSFCALVEHELMHCAQKRNPYGVPMFSRTTGKPLFALRGHDVEEFVGIVERYGAYDLGVQRLVRAASQPPAIDLAKIARVCGTVEQRAA